MARWLKLNVEEASGFDFKITEAIKKALPNLKLKVGADIREYLTWTELGDFVYIQTALYDLENKNRINKETEVETQMWDKIISENNWQVVYDVIQEAI